MAKKGSKKAVKKESVPSAKKPKGARWVREAPLLPDPPPLRFDVAITNTDLTGLAVDFIGGAAALSRQAICWDFYSDPHMHIRKEVGDRRLNDDMLQLMEKNIEDNLACPGIKYENDWSKEWNKLEGKVAVLVSPGPSLRFQIEQLRELKQDEEFVFFATNRAIRALPPDYFVCVERRGRKEWFDNISSAQLSNTTLLATPQTCSNVVKMFEKVSWGWTNLGKFGWDTRINWLAFMDGQSLSTAATTLWMQHKLKPKAIILVGHDFALDFNRVDDKTLDITHAYFDQKYSDSIYAVREDWKPDYLTVMQDKWTGKPCLRNRALSVFRDSFETTCWVTDQKAGIPVINATEGGMLNWRNMSLRNAVAATKAL